jgi:hypothetical protein
VGKLFEREVKFLFLQAAAWSVEGCEAAACFFSGQAVFFSPGLYVFNGKRFCLGFFCRRPTGRVALEGDWEE